MNKQQKAPAPRDSRADAKDQAFGARSFREHADALLAALDLSFAIVPPERLASVLAWKDPLPPESAAHLARLAAKHKHDGK